MNNLKHFIPISRILEIFLSLQAFQYERVLYDFINIKTEARLFEN